MTASLSVVMCGRVDARISFAKFEKELTHNVALVQRSFPNFEFVFAEWGDPVGDRAPLRDLACDILRVVYVPYRIAKLHEPPDVFGEFVAKNVGIRATNVHVRTDSVHLVAVTNMDVFFSPELVETLAATMVKHETVYRAPRWDFDIAAETPYDTGIELQKYTVGAYWTEAAGDFTAMTKPSWEKLRGYYEAPGYRMHIDAEVVTLALNSGFATVELPNVYHRKHKGMFAGGTPNLGHGICEEKLRYPHHRATKPRHDNWGLSDYRLEVRPYGYEVVEP